MADEAMQNFLARMQDKQVRKQAFSDNYRAKRIGEYDQLGKEIQDVLSAGQVVDKATGQMRPLSPEEKTQLKTTQEHVNQYLQKLYNPKIDPFGGELQEDPLHRLTDKLHLTKPPQQTGQKAGEIESERRGFQTDFGATPATAGAEGRQEKERNIEQFRALGKKYGLPDQAIEQITERMIGGPGTIPKEKWKLVQGTLDGKPFTARMNEATGEVTDLGGNEVTGFQMAGKPPTSTQINLEAYENAFDPPAKWADMTPAQKSYFPEWVKRQSAALTTGQHVMLTTDREGKIIPITVQTTSERQPGGAGGTPQPPGLRGKGEGRPGAASVSKKEGHPGKGDPSKGLGTKRAGVVGVGGAVGEKPNKDLLEARANYRLGIDRAKTMHRDLEAIKKKFKETGEIDQQAMLSILFNHIGMTSGAQKGTRITQTMIDEAQESAPWVSRLLARIGVGNALDDMALRGIVLTQDQMQDMVDLADRKVKILFEHAKDAEKSGSPEAPSKEVGGQGSDVDDIIKALKGGK